MASGKTLAGRAGCIFQIAFRMCLVTQTEGKGVASRVVRVVRNRLPGREMQETQTRRSDPCFGETPWRRAWHPLQCSCLESPVDGGACWAAVHGVAQSRTRLKRLSGSSSTHSCLLHGRKILTERLFKPFDFKHSPVFYWNFLFICLFRLVKNKDSGPITLYGLFLIEGKLNLNILFLHYVSSK